MDKKTSYCLITSTKYCIHQQMLIIKSLK